MNKITILIMILILVLTPKNTVKAASWSVTNPVNGLDSSITLENIETADLHNQVVKANLTLQPVVVDSENVKKRYETPKTLQDMAKELVTKQFGANQFAAFDAIVRRESNWNPNAVNPTSGACGLGQALPCGKVADRSPVGQVQWMVKYISDRYGNPANAWRFWQGHNWY